MKTEMAKNTHTKNNKDCLKTSLDDCPHFLLSVETVISFGLPSSRGVRETGDGREIRGDYTRGRGGSERGALLYGCQEESSSSIWTLVSVEH